MTTGVFFLLAMLLTLTPTISNTHTIDYEQYKNHQYATTNPPFDQSNQLKVTTRKMARVDRYKFDQSNPTKLTSHQNNLKVTSHDNKPNTSTYQPHSYSYVLFDQSNHPSLNHVTSSTNHTSTSQSNAHESYAELKAPFEISTEFFYVPKPTTKRSLTTKKRPFEPNDLCTSPDCASWVKTQTNEYLRNEIWTLPVLIVSIITMFMIVSFEVLVLCKLSRTKPSQRHLFLGQMLLIGLFSCSALAGILTLIPTVITCGIVRFGMGVVYTIVFATLLVKCVFLLSLNSGIYLPASYQGLLLLFAILIQVVIATQWLINAPPKLETIQVYERALTKYRFLVVADDTYPTTTTVCQTTYLELMTSLVYVIFLIAFDVVLAIKSRGIHDNYREAFYIGVTITLSILIWLVWIPTGLATNVRHKDACLAFGLLATSLVTFLIMFIPKGRQLATIGRGCVDDNERSTLSRSISGHSPSFFHFKPMKSFASYGFSSKRRRGTGVETITTMSGDSLFAPADDRNIYTTLQPTLSSNPNVYFQRPPMHVGMMY